jgi:hypothetical protein
VCDGAGGFLTKSGQLFPAFPGSENGIAKAQKTSKTPKIKPKNFLLKRVRQRMLLEFAIGMFFFCWSFG